MESTCRRPTFFLLANAKLLLLSRSKQRERERERAPPLLLFTDAIFEKRTTPTCERTRNASIRRVRERELERANRSKDFFVSRERAFFNDSFFPSSSRSFSLSTSKAFTSFPSSLFFFHSPPFFAAEYKLRKIRKCHSLTRQRRWPSG